LNKVPTVAVLPTNPAADLDRHVEGTIAMAPNGIVNRSSMGASIFASRFSEAFFLTGKGAGVQTSGGSSWHLVATSSGPLAGFVFFLDPSGGPAGNSELSGTSQLYFEGVIYLPQQILKLSGGSSASTQSPFTACMADTYDLSSSSTLNINSDRTKTSVPIPPAIFGSGGGKPRLVN
jgi:hypothetical protein